MIEQQEPPPQRAGAPTPCCPPAVGGTYSGHGPMCILDGWGGASKAKPGVTGALEVSATTGFVSVVCTQRQLGESVGSTVMPGMTMVIVLRDVVRIVLAGPPDSTPASGSYRILITELTGPSTM